MRPLVALPNLMLITRLLFFAGFFSSSSLQAQSPSLQINGNGAGETHYEKSIAVPNSVLVLKRVNLYIFSRSPKFNLATFIIRNATRFQRLFNSRKMEMITIRNAAELNEELESKMGKHGGNMIGTLWLDSHGVYKKGKSLFILGRDTIDHRDLRNEEILGNLLALKPYCDTGTKIVLGACYAGASYSRPLSQWMPASRMDGDSLIIAMGSIFPQSRIYATESWIMTSPLLFGHSWALAGHPLEGKFWDEIYRPVWKGMGNWYLYSGQSGQIVQVNTIYLDRHGALKLNEKNWLDARNHRRKMESNLEKLAPNRYKVYKK